jgi:hypothetical protein
MQHPFLRLAIGAALVLGVAVSGLGSTAADAQTVMKQCGAQWQAAKAAGAAMPRSAISTAQPR